MLDLKLSAKLSNHSIVEISPIVGDNPFEGSIAADEVVSDECVLHPKIYPLDLGLCFIMNIIMHCIHTLLWDQNTLVIKSSSSLKIDCIDKLLK